MLGHVHHPGLHKIHLRAAVRECLGVERYAGPGAQTQSVLHLRPGRRHVDWRCVCSPTLGPASTVRYTESSAHRRRRRSLQQMNFKRCTTGLVYWATLRMSLMRFGARSGAKRLEPTGSRLGFSRRTDTTFRGNCPGRETFLQWFTHTAIRAATQRPSSGIRKPDTIQSWLTKKSGVQLSRKQMHDVNIHVVVFTPKMLSQPLLIAKCTWAEPDLVHLPTVGVTAILSQIIASLTGGTLAGIEDAIFNLPQTQTENDKAWAKCRRSQPDWCAKETAAHGSCGDGRGGPSLGRPR